MVVEIGIRPERIEPGKPSQNGRHERMHRTLKEETALPQDLVWMHNRPPLIHSVKNLIR
ncbi:integrase core domain protein [Leptospira vanthielii serovar Holland str. Waz Holland = ATCC 700522]|uniref:Integrase core domain protein n=1 Tax=Leptospira vanthielii serovar Holland str. Waz Holland = ATCC 700522 TaxID=1218591 RepID=N1WEG1_9LEPT|nr:integrase core domain-containing protein [Leptospira vanthielii]EMY71582.1 integrase core domain protein [Leptospira vanthielii serovar Holland str. Waz Holland = ATCC 700522]